MAQEEKKEYYIQRQGVSGRRRQRKNKEGKQKTAYFTYTPKGSNFIQEYYGIIGIDSSTDFRNEEGEHISPNPYAVGMAHNVLESTSFMSDNELTSLNYFYYLLRNLADKMARKEKEYLKMKIWQLESEQIHLADGILYSLKDAYKRDSMSEAYSLLMTSAKSIDEITDQIQKAVEFQKTHPDSKSLQGIMSRMNGFWDNISFEKILKSTDEGRALWEKMESDLVLSNKPLQTQLNWEEIAQEVTRLVLQEIDPGADMENTLYGNILDVFKRNLLIKEDGYLNVLKAVRDGDKEALQKFKKDPKLAGYVNYHKHVKKTKKGKKENGKTTYVGRSTNAFLSDLFDSINIGMLGEKSTLQIAARLHATGLNVGSQMVTHQTLLNEFYRRFGKTDTILIDSASADINVDGIDKEVLEKYQEMIKQYREQENKKGGASIDTLLENLKSLKEKLQDLFIVKVNTKAYKSNLDLGVLYEGPINTMLGKAGKISKMLKEEMEGKSSDDHRGRFRLGHQARAFDNLISMLNNTFEKGYMHGNIARIEHWIAAACFIWMWDGVEEEIEDMVKDVPDKLNTIYLFQSGAAMYSASQIIRALAEELKSQDVESKYIRFADVNIKPTTSITDAFYMRLMRDYPINKEEMGYAQQMDVLRKRWEYLRNVSLRETKMSIHFNQRELDRLLGNLSVINQI